MIYKLGEITNYRIKRVKFIAKQSTE